MRSAALSIAALLIKNSGFYFIFDPKRDLDHP